MDGKFGEMFYYHKLYNKTQHFDENTVKQVHIKSCKQTTRTPWYTENNSPQCRTWMVDSRKKFTHKEVKNDFQLEDYLKTIRNPAHRISITRLQLVVHSLYLQTEKFENKGASISVEDRTCLICKINSIENKLHFLMYCQEYDNIRHELHSLI